MEPADTLLTLESRAFVLPVSVFDAHEQWLRAKEQVKTAKL